MNVETEIKLDQFKARDYQLPVVDAFFKQKKRKIMLVWPRRSGKDILCFNFLIKAAFRKVAVYFMVYPTYKQGKKILWDSITNDGKAFLSFIPKELIKGLNSQELKITLINGSIIQIVGSNDIDSLMGTNAQGIVYSEYALQDPRAYQFLNPIIRGNGGWQIFISTPRGKNHMWQMFQIALNSPEDWFVSKLTLNDTNHIPLAEIEKDRQEGLISEDLILQEYYTSFDFGVEGTIYGKYLDKMKINGQIGQVPYEHGHAVYTSWDIGRDTTSIIFFQVIGQAVRVIDYYEKAGEVLEYFVRIIESKGYRYAKHFFPHDMEVTEWAGPKITRVEKARNMGLKAYLVPKLSVDDGIEHVRCTLSKVWIDEHNCRKLIDCLENYRREMDPNTRVYGTKPLHNWASHGSDSFRYMCIALPQTGQGTTPADIDRRWNQAIGGNNLPGIFGGQFDTPYI